MKPAVQVHPGTGPPLLMVHGILAGPAQFEPNLAALSRVCRPVVVELFGHGTSPSPDEATAYYPDAYVQVFEELREELGADQWFLLGQSLGAGLTLYYALGHPSRVRAHLMTNSATAFGDAAWVATHRPMFDEIVSAVDREGRAALERLPIHPRQARRMPDAIKRKLCEEAARHDPRGTALTIAHTTPRAACGDRLAQNQVPTLLLCGVHEKRFEERRRFAEAHMPQLEVVELPGGHAVNVDAAGRFNAAAVDFLKRHL